MSSVAAPVETSPHPLRERSRTGKIPAMTPPPPVLRPYRPEDREALFDICVRTGHEGGDARHLYPDPDLLPNIFAAPYAALEPDLAFVVEDGGRAVGYIVGTADTASFVDRYRAEWLPGLAVRHPAPVREPATPTEAMTALMHTPERMILPSWPTTRPTCTSTCSRPTSARDTGDG